MKKNMVMAMCLTSCAMAFGQGKDDFMRQQAYAEMQRVSGQVDVLQSNLNELQSRVGRLEGGNGSQGLRQEIDALKAAVADIRKQREEKESDSWQRLLHTKNREEAWTVLSQFVVENQIKCVDFARTAYCHITEGFARENLRTLRKASTEIRKAKPLHKVNRRREMIGLRKIDPSLAIEKNTWFHLGEN